MAIAFALSLSAPALAAQGDPFLDQCLLPAAASGCSAGAGPGNAMATVISANQKWVYTTTWGGTVGIDVYDRGDRGVLTRRAGPSGCLSTSGNAGACTANPLLGSSAWDLNISSDGRNLYYPGPSGNLLVFSIDQSNGTLAQIQCLGSGAGCTPLRGAGSNLYTGALDSAGSSYYLRVSNGLLVFDRAADGKLTQKSGSDGCFTEPGTAGCTPAFGLGSQGFQINVAPDGKGVYVSNQTPGGISIFQRLSDGTLLQTNGTAGGCITTDGSSNGVASRCVSSGNVALSNSWAAQLDPQGNNVYVSGSSGMTVFARNKTSQLLTQVECYVEGAAASGCQGRIGVTAMHTVMVPDGSELIASSPVYNSIGFLSRNASTGKLTQRAGSRGCFSSSGNAGACQTLASINSYAGLAISADGLNVYGGFSGSGLMLDLQRDFAPTCDSKTVDVPFQTSVAVPLTCTDVNGDTLSLAVASQPFNGSLGGGGTIDTSTNTVRYNPPLGFTGADGFTYTATGRAVTSAAATVTLNVQPPPPPVIQQATQNSPTQVASTPPSRIAVTLGFAFSSSTNKQTKFTRLSVGGVPSGATVTVTCVSGACPSSLVAKKKKGKKTVTVAKPLVLKKSGTVSLAKLISKPLKAGTRLQVLVTKPGAIGAAKIFTVGKRKAPTVATKCVAVGATKASAC